jgi:hypothetical protein
MSEWIEWKGGDCPVPGDTFVEVKDRDGTLWSEWPASFHDWKHGTDFPDEEPVSYRIITKPEPHEDQSSSPGL